MEHSYSYQNGQSVGQDIQQWLEKRVNQTVYIEKIEDGDTDQVQIQVEKVRLAQQQKHDPDDYVADQALLLYGSGTQSVGFEQSSQQVTGAEIPQHVYEIPLTSNMMLEEDGGRLLLSTDRAVYRFNQSS